MNIIIPAISFHLFSACARVQGDWGGRVLGHSPPTKVGVSFTSGENPNTFDTIRLLKDLAEIRKV